MGVVVKYVQTDKLTGRLIFRRAFPATLRRAISGQPRELVRSLKSKQLDAVALALYDQALEEYERLTSTARKAVAGSFDQLDTPRIAWLVETYASGLLAEDERQRVLGFADREWNEANELGYSSVLEDCTGPEIRTMFEADAMALAHRSGWHFDAQSEAFAILCYQMLKARIDVAQAQVARDNGVVVDAPASVSDSIKSA